MMLSARRSRLPILLVLAAMAGCEGSGQAGTAATVRDTLPNGAERVRYGSLLFEPPEPVLPNLSIGTLEGEAPFIFGDVRGIEVGLDGAIYVLDHQAAEVRVFEADGAFRDYAARQGQGPGEIMQANGIVRAPDGTMWVQDHGQWELIRLEPGGGEVERRPMPARQFGYLWGGAVDEDGRIWTGWSEPLDAAGPDTVEPGLRETAMAQSVIVHNPATGGEDTIRVATAVSRSYVAATQGGWSFRSIPFQASPLSAVDPAGAVWSTTGDAIGSADWIARVTPHWSSRSNTH